MFDIYLYAALSQASGVSTDGRLLILKLTDDDIAAIDFEGNATRLSPEIEHSTAVTADPSSPHNEIVEVPGAVLADVKL